ncbi:Site-specific recombinase XerD [Soonwooa buanensis]|uniref:Site-specific recombinase XerD n=1 Tax=Soonwooa buanensis TaxID=619805 RepID=A0A1T5EWJ3_9FLAO|nr:site-specific integrase [Soonwooa buanensis]SKB88303.1 Site-specific recombinase XerD [Soonwooa buanensis]
MASLKFILKNKAHSNGLFPIYLRVTKDRKSKLISTGFYCEKAHWNDNKNEFRKTHLQYQQKNSTLEKIKAKAEKVFSDAIAENNDLTLPEFEELFFSYKAEKKISVNEFWTTTIDNLTKSGRTGNARYYADCKRAFFNFLNNKTIYFRDISPLLLDKYEIHLRTRGSSDSGIAVRMRAIRALYNDAVKKGLISKDNYPFDAYKISKLKASSNKRAISFDNIQKIRTLDLTIIPQLTNSRNYFIFSYYTRGMNFYDIMKLKWDNISEGLIIYTRSKTKTKLTVKITEPVQEILDYYSKGKKKTKYIFPIILNDESSPIQLEYRKEKTLKKFNKDLKKIAELCQIDASLTSYVARHSFATNLKQKGVSTDVISEAMGHQNIAITQAYLKDLENSVIDEAVEKLL